ncbi:DUF2000 domain-containing protein [Solihabitans fulvus]|uniref:DUF2000 domain-containing protein n=1 Tax=Solihabitans fulvus TaxID=1892852 RepID=A0A5B2WTX0_9PSEU|nr:DUF2000 domain-containing protein [Solihabitans fulvus]KAA2253879.1 DUF2000 domain-containing protein [Solihabitans fulvus]
MSAHTKLAIAVRADLAPWQQLNVTAFLASGLALGGPEVTGEAYQDASGTKYLPMFRLPVVVYEADAAALAAMRDRAVTRELATAVYTEELFGTGNDEDNRAAVLAVAVQDLRLVGVAVHGPRNAVDKACKGLVLHP